MSPRAGSRAVTPGLAALLVLASCGGGASSGGRGSQPSRSSSASPGPAAQRTLAASPTYGAGPRGPLAPSQAVTPQGRSAPGIPAEGPYVYAQSGTEELCQGASCDRRELPPTRTMTVAYAEQGASGTVVVTEGWVSGMRFVRDTTSFTERRALITELRVRLAYRGVEFEDSYRPDPPVESLRLPLAPGASWSGTWTADVSGEYEIVVGPLQDVSAGGRSVRAFRLETTTTFTGELEGTQEITYWIDPATLVAVRSKGSISVKGLLGEYRTTFDAVLRSAPGT